MEDEVVRWRRSGVFGLVLALLGLVFCNAAVAQVEEAHVLRVSTDAASRADHEAIWGDNTAFATIQGAVDQAELDPAGASYVILVEEGTYAETHLSPGGTVTPGLVVNAGSNITLRGVFGTAGGAGRAEVTIDGAGGSYAVRIQGSGSRVTLDTIDITGGGAGLQIEGQGENEIAAPAVMNCVIRGNDDGIDCLEHSAPNIVNSMIVDNADSGIVCHGDSAPSLMSNTISGNTTGMTVLDDIELDITNTIAYGNTGAWDIDVVAVTAELTVQFSNVGNANHPVGPGPGNIDALPLFDADYKLQEPDALDAATWSPCIDAGTDAGTLPLDFEGELRDYNVPFIPDTGVGTVDIGADEYVPIGYVSPVPVAYAIPDPTSVQPPGGLVFFASWQGTAITTVTGDNASYTNTISTTAVSGAGTGYYIGVNSTEITPFNAESPTGDGVWNIRVEGEVAGTFLIDTAPPTVEPLPPNPYGVLDDHNDIIDVSALDPLLIDPLYWTNNWGLPDLFVPVGDVVPNDGLNFFFNTGAQRVDNSIAGTGEELLRINFVVTATDPPAGAAGVAAGFGEFRAPSGQPIIRDESSGDYYTPPNLPNPADPRTVPGPGPGPITWVLVFEPGVEGRYPIDIVAEDAAGNISGSLPLTVYWDKTPPETRITSKPRSEEPSTRASFTWRVTGEVAPTFNTALQDWDSVGSFWVTVRPFTYFLLSNVTTYSGLLVGHTYRFVVLGIDDAGNLETTVTPDNNWVWTVSNPVPNTVITSGPPRVMPLNLMGPTSWIFRFKEVPEDPAVGFEYKYTHTLAPDIEGVWTETLGNSTYDSLTTVPGLPEPTGDQAVQYVFSVRAWKDYDGEEGLEPRLYDPTPATYTWTVVPPANVNDPGVPRPSPGDPYYPDFPPGVSVNYGVGGYVDAPGEQPVKYIREEALRK
jgi:parallel beta-helix repeat protein